MSKTAHATTGSSIALRQDSLSLMDAERGPGRPFPSLLLRALLYDVSTHTNTHKKKTETCYDDTARRLALARAGGRGHTHPHTHIYSCTYTRAQTRIHTRALKVFIKGIERVKKKSKDVGEKEGREGGGGEKGAGR